MLQEIGVPAPPGLAQLWAGSEPGPGTAPQDVAEPREDVGTEGLAATPSPGNVEDMYELLEKLGR